MRTYSANHKPLPERDIDPHRIDDVVAAARRMPDVTPTVAKNLGKFLRLVHFAGDPTGGASKGSQALYRRILNQLLEPAPSPDGSTTPRMYVSAAWSPMSFGELAAAA